MSDEKPLLLTRQEAAALMTISVRTLDELIAKGSFAVVRIGRSVRIRPAAIERYCDAMETNLTRKRRDAISGKKPKGGEG